MNNNWSPPKSGDSYDFGDWTTTRDAILAAYKECNLTIPKSIDPDIWNLIGLALDYDRYHRRFTCNECKELIPYSQDIRCLDCEATYCKKCAVNHFWPNGRPR